MQFTVTLTNPIDIPVDVDITFADGTATGGPLVATPAGTDFINDKQTISFAAGSTTSVSSPISVKVIGDLLVEGGVGTNTLIFGSENFTASVELTTASQTALGARLSKVDDDHATDSNATGTITDDDSATVSITSAPSPLQENSGVSNIVVTMTEASSSAIVVNYTVSSSDSDLTVDDFTHKGDGMGAAAKLSFPQRNGNDSRWFQDGHHSDLRLDRQLAGRR